MTGICLSRGVGAGQADQATASPIFTKTSINYYLTMEICASLAIFPDQCLICLIKIQLIPTPLLSPYTLYIARYI